MCVLFCVFNLNVNTLIQQQTCFRTSKPPNHHTNQPFKLQARAAQLLVNREIRTRKPQNHTKMKVLQSFLFSMSLLMIFFSSSSSALPDRACAPPHDKLPFCDVTLPREDRVDDLISRLELDEKPYLLIARESPLGNIKMYLAPWKRIEDPMD